MPGVLEGDPVRSTAVEVNQLGLKTQYCVRIAKFYTPKNGSNLLAWSENTAAMCFYCQTINLQDQCNSTRVV